MSDIFDAASDTEEMHRDMAIKAVRARQKSVYTGHCLYCNEQINIGTFCDAECREGQEYENKIKRIKGTR